MPRQRRAPALTALPCVLPLLGCAAAPPPLVVPDGLLTCREEPAAPADPDDRALAGWVLDLAEAGADCRARLAAVRGLVRHDVDR